MTERKLLATAALLATLAAPASANEPAKPDRAADAPIEAVVLHRVFSGFYACSEHFDSELPYLGDALGSDCTVFDSLQPGQDETGWFAKAYRGDGKDNQDWYGWHQPVLAPFDGTVLEVHDNPVTNAPGHPNPKPASRIVFVRDDGTHVMYGHVAEVSVGEGDRVRAGQPVARVGNNGYARAPHIHIGAWRGKTPLQIRFDLASRQLTSKQ